MSRDLPADLETAIDEPVVRPFFALHIALPDVVRVWSGVGDLEFEDADGVVQTWTGAGEIGELETIGETTDGTATGMRATLHHVPSELADDVAEQATKGAALEVHIGALNETFQTVEAAQLIWKGRVDTYVIRDSGTELSVEVTGESRGIDQRRPAIKRMTSEYQKRLYPDDDFFDYVPQLTEISILWAQAEQKSVVAGSVTSAGGFASAVARRFD